MRMMRGSLLSLLLLTGGVVGVDSCDPEVTLVQERTEMAGFIEPHTPGSGAPEEYVIPDDSPIRQILGDDVDLNRVTYIRTALENAGQPPRVILILIPGFLGGGANFDPIARDLVREQNGNLEVWAVDRRTNQLEDRRGGLHARAAAEAAGNIDETRQAIAEGVRFYFPTATLDLDENGQPDGPFLLPDAVPADGDSDFQRLSQDDARGILAHWGVDTYARDWRELVLAARAIVGEDGLVLFGGHSMGTTWTGVFAAYDFDVGPGVEAGHQLVDGLLLLEGGGSRGPSASALDLAAYQANITALETPGGPDVYLASLFDFIDATAIGTAGELNGIAGTFDPTGDSVMQQTPLFGEFPVNQLLAAPLTNRSLTGFFLDDDFTLNSAFSASFGFSANGSNFLNPLGAILGSDTYAPVDEGIVRTWLNFDDPRYDAEHPDPLTCPPLDPSPGINDGLTGCAIKDRGPKPGPGEFGRWGVEREVTDVNTLLATLYETGNASEWYFVSGRVNQDLAYGHDSSALGAPELLNVTQNANVDVPVLGIGGSNGLTATEASFGAYLASIASTDTEVVIVEGYAHLDVVSAAENEAVPPIIDWINRLLQQKLLGN